MKRALGFMNKSQAIAYNTYIGGVSATISTAALLATKLGISVGNISNFEVVGSDIKCKITGSYTIPNNSFQFNTTPCTYYTDSDYLVTSIGNSAFYATDAFLGYDAVFENCTTVNSSAFSRTKAKKYLLKNATSVGTACFLECEALVYYLPNCTTLGNAVSGGIPGAYTLIWDYCLNLASAKIYVHPSLATANAGSPDDDLVAAADGGATVRYVTNFTAPNTVTNLSVGTVYNTAIQLNFTPPSSTNAIDYYECYANGVYKNNITASGQYITGLTPSTSYTIEAVAVDIFYNKSTSNTVTQSTTNTALDTDANAYIVASNNGGFQPEINTLFTDLKSASLYTKLQAFYPFLGTTAAQHKWNAKNPLDTNGAFRLVFTGNPSFSNNGYLTGGGHADTFLIPNSVQNVNSNGLTVVIGTNNNASTNDTAIGAFGSGSNASWIVVKGNNATYLRELRLNFAAVQQSGVNEAKGIWTGTRQSATVSKLIRNNSLIGTATATGTLPTYPIWIGDLNNNGSAYGSTSQRIQFAAIHEGLSDAEVATFHTIIDNFETALGRKTW